MFLPFKKKWSMEVRFATKKLWWLASGFKPSNLRLRWAI
jgi:hypothetical protein